MYGVWHPSRLHKNKVLNMKDKAIENIHKIISILDYMQRTPSLRYRQLSISAASCHVIHCPR